MIPGADNYPSDSGACFVRNTSDPECEASLNYTAAGSRSQEILLFNAWRVTGCDLKHFE